jgi:hypothetical protein
MLHGSTPSVELAITLFLPQSFQVIPALNFRPLSVERVLKWRVPISHRLDRFYPNEQL